MPREPRRICLGLAVLVANTFALIPAAHAQGKWTNVAPFPDPREEVLGAAAAGKMYVFAGLIPLWHTAGLVYEYDPAANQWTKRKPMALPSHHVAFTTYNDKIYAFGGFVYPESGPAAWVPIDNAFEYDPSKDTWKALAPMPIKRGAAVAATFGDKIYVIGGVTTQPEFGGWDPQGKAWQIEGHGVDPDVKLDLGPDGFINGQDAQLDYAIKDLMTRIATQAPKLAPAPPIPPRPLVPVK